jgi:hypothetical protein
MFLMAGLAALAGGAARAQTPPPPATAPASPPSPTTPPPVKPAPTGPVAPPPELEPLNAVVATRKGLTLRLPAHDCAKKADFAWYIERRGDVTTVAFARKRLNPCRRPRGASLEIAFTYAEMGLDPAAPLVVLNPLAAPEKSRRR